MISRRKAIEIIRECRDIHQEYINNPKHCGLRVGNKKWHEEWVLKYNQVIEVLEAII